MRTPADAALRAIVTRIKAVSDPELYDDPTLDGYPLTDNPTADCLAIATAALEGHQLSIDPEPREPRSRQRRSKRTHRHPDGSDGDA
jgi:hypothetical protein